MEGAKFTLSFSKTVEKKVLQQSALRVVPVKNNSNKKHIIESIEDNVIAGNEEETTELVIPLIVDDRAASFKNKTNELLKAKKESEDSVKLPNSDDGGVQAEDEVPLTLDQMAEKEILADIHGDKNKVNIESTRAIVQPSDNTEENTTTDGKLPTMDDFEEVGIESFGAALMRGMGWKKDEGIGNIKNRKVVDIIEASSGRTLDNSGERSGASPGAAGGEEDELPLVKGCYVFLHAGRHKNTYGVVDCVEEDHIMVRTAMGGGAVVREVPANARVVTHKLYRDQSRVINKEMYDEYKNAPHGNKKSKDKKRRRQSDSDAETPKTKADSDSVHDTNESGDKNSTIGRPEQSPTSTRDLRDDLTNDSPVDTSVKEELSPSSVSESNIKVENDGRDKSEYEKSEEYSSSKYNKKSNTTSDKSSNSSKLNTSDDRDRNNRDNRHKNASKTENRERSDYYASHKNDRERNRRSPDHRDKQNYSYAEERRSKNANEDKRHYSSREQKETNGKIRSGEQKYRDSRSDNSNVADGRSHREEKRPLTAAEVIAAKYGNCGARAGQAPWVREGLTVRIICDKYKGGKYFKEKVLVESVPTGDACVCRTPAGKRLTRVPPSALETVIPKHPGPTTVMVLRGQFQGMVGEVLEQHKRDQEASVQLVDEPDVITRLQYEDICQYEYTHR